MTELRNNGKRELQEGRAQASRQAATEKGITKSGNRFRHSVTPSFRHSQSGAVMMEYVIVAVLIAAACVVGVLVFSRSVARGWMISGTGTTLQSGKAAELQKKAQDKAAEESKIGENYHDSFHD